jgi:hypothetical protein
MALLEVTRQRAWRACNKVLVDLGYAPATLGEFAHVYDPEETATETAQRIWHLREIREAP